MSPLAFAHRKSVIPTFAVSLPWMNCWAADFRAAQSAKSADQSSNGTALTVSILVQAFDAGECCAWIDAGGTFDPDRRPKQVYASNNCSGLTASALYFPDRRHLAIISYVSQGALGDDYATVRVPRSWVPWASVAYRGVGSWDFKNN